MLMMLTWMIVSNSLVLLNCFITKIFNHDDILIDLRSFQDNWELVS